MEMDQAMVVLLQLLLEDHLVEMVQPQVLKAYQNFIQEAEVQLVIAMEELVV